MSAAEGDKMSDVLLMDDRLSCSLRLDIGGMIHFNGWETREMML